MKKFAVVMLVVLCGLTLVVGHAQEVTSVNAVGFVRLSLARGEFFLACLNFDMLDANHCITNVLNAAELPGGTTIYTWDAGAQQYGASETLVLFGGAHWDPGTNNIVKGASFWIRIPGSASEASYDLTINGQVPSDATIPVGIASGFTFAGNPYPVEEVITDTAIGDAATGGDTVYFWRNGWVGETYVLFGGGHWEPGTNVFAPGEGVLYRTSGSSKTWTEDKSYTWP